jgi:hypothetical protein
MQALLIAGVCLSCCEQRDELEPTRILTAPGVDVGKLLRIKDAGGYYVTHSIAAANC